MSGTPRLRFAPSPSGYLHIGGARTALFNWLYARKMGGTLVLRVEDTDQSRSSEASLAAILEGLRWLGLDWDEGPEVGGSFGPYLQTERTAIYREHADRLIAEGKAYRCACTKDTLDKQRAKAAEAGERFRYPGTCSDREIGADTDHVVRIRTPTEGATAFEDLVRGTITTPHDTLQDEVILRQDGLPLYNFGAVVDDATMKIDLVARGDDHLNNTARQLLIYQALGYTPPKFAHLPMILGEDKKRLSKRHGAVSVTWYREQGYLPHALLNYLVRLGWSLDDKSEVFSVDDLLEHFDFSRVTKSAAVFDNEKLDWLNQHWMKESAPAALATDVATRLRAMGFEAAADDKLAAIVAAMQPRTSTLAEMAKKAAVFYRSGIETYDPKAVKKFLAPKFRPQLESARAHLATLTPYDPEAMEAWARAYAESAGLGLGKVAQPLRVALVGGTASPGIFETIAFIGRDESLARIDTALGMIDTAPASSGAPEG